MMTTHVVLTGSMNVLVQTSRWNAGITNANLMSHALEQVLHAPVQLLRSRPVCMLAKPKKFKGGRLDEFMSAGEAEAKFGPQRYAAVYDDLRKLEVSKEKSEKQRAYSRRVYDALKKQLFFDHAFLSLMGCAIVWSLFDAMATRSYAAGAALGALYLFLSQRSADSFGATSFEEKKSGPPALVAPILMVLLVAKNPEQISFLPIFAGFATERLAYVMQATYPTDFGLSADEASDAEL